MNQNIEESAERTEKILVNCQEKSVNKETLEAFFAFLKQTMTFPCEVIGKADLVKYILYDIENSGDDMYGILGKLRLMDDQKKECIVPLCDLKAMDNRSLEFVILFDYANWFVNSQF